MPSRRGPFGVDEFLPIWPFLKMAVDKMLFEGRQKIRDNVKRGSLPLVLRKMVKRFGLSETHYPINTNPPKPVLLISEHVDLDKAALLVRAAAKDLVEKNSMRRLKAAMWLKTKDDGPHMRLKHQLKLDAYGTMGRLIA